MAERPPHRHVVGAAQPLDRDDARFGNRADCAGVLDEPFYAAYPRAERQGPPDARRRAGLAAAGLARGRRACAGAAVAPGGILYQKQMTPPHAAGDRPRLDGRASINVFLIRAPERVVASYADQARGGRPRRTSASCAGRALRPRRRPAGRRPAGRRRRGGARRSRRHAPPALRRAGFAFDPRMLAWPAGPRPSDGVWAAHWYASVNASTGFAPPEAAPPPPDRRPSRAGRRRPPRLRAPAPPRCCDPPSARRCIEINHCDARRTARGQNSFALP